MPEKSKQQELDEALDDFVSYLAQLEHDIITIANHLGLIRGLDGQLVHKDAPATKEDGERLIEEIKNLSNERTY